MGRVDVAVVGAGIMGASTAWWLARQGKSVIVLERFAAGHVNGSSHGTERIFRLTHADPFWARQCVESLPLWRELEDDVRESLLLTTGHLDLGTPSDLAPKVSTAELCGIATRWMDPVEVTERWPGLSVSGPALFHAEGGRTNAEATVAAMLRRVVELGGDVRFETPVQSIATAAGGVEIVTDGATISAGVAVVTAAGWTPDLIPFVTGLPTITSSTGQVAFFTPKDSSLLWPTFIDPEVYGMSTPQGRIRLGHFLHAAPTHPDRRSFEPDPHVRSLLEQWAETHLPGVDPQPVGELSCLFGETQDDDFVIDRQGPVVVGCGFGGHGFKFAPLVGRMLAELASGDGTRVARFTLGR